MAALSKFITLMLSLRASQAVVVPHKLSENSTGLVRREPPTILPDGLSQTQLMQISDAIIEACTFARIGSSAAFEGGSVFQKYFPAGSATQVKGVFDRIVGDDTNSQCAEELSQITIAADFMDQGSLFICKDPLQDMGQLLDGTADFPIMILCPAGLLHPSQFTDYSALDPPGPEARTCAGLDPRTSSKMLTLGGIILHEYTHFESLVVPPLQEETKDKDGAGNDIYGPLAVQAIQSQELATTTAESYTWFALEAAWALNCNLEFGPAEPGDDEDILREETPCSEPMPDA